MKKLTGILCTLSLLIAVCSFTFPKDDAVSARVKSAFEKTFTSSSDVYWERINEFYVVSFKVNDRDFAAAYNEDGELISASRYINLSELPLSVGIALQDKYPGYTIDKTVRELTIDGQSSYYLKGENSKHLVTIKATSSGDLSIESKTKK